MQSKEERLQEVCRQRDDAKDRMLNASAAFEVQSDVVSILREELKESLQRLDILRADYLTKSNAWLGYYQMAQRLELKEVED